MSDVKKNVEKGIIDDTHLEEDIYGHLTKLKVPKEQPGGSRADDWEFLNDQSARDKKE